MSSHYIRKNNNQFFIKNNNGQPSLFTDNPQFNVVIEILSLLDLNSSSMITVKNLVNQNDYYGAIEEWKTIVLNRLRNIKFGLLNTKASHIDILRNYVWQYVAEYLVNNVALENYYSLPYFTGYYSDANATFSNEFLDIYGMASDPNINNPINWIAKLPQTLSSGDFTIVLENSTTNQDKASYGNLYRPLMPLVTKYWAKMI